MKSKIISWGRLLRLPNLFTVPGDPLVGFIALSGGNIDNEHDKKLLLVMFVAILLYLYGLVTNDIVDLENDKHERPYRPLPANLISIFSAKFASIVFAISSMAITYFISIHTFIFSIILFMFITLYNFQFKSHVALGPLLLALCRVTSIMLGASFAPGTNANIQALYFIIPTVFFYIYGVSIVAQNEMNTGEKRRGRGPILISILFSLLTIMFFVVVMFHIPNNSKIEVNSILFGIALYLWFVAVSFKHIIIFTRKQPPVIIQKGIGSLIRNLMILQAAWCAISELPIIATVIVILAFNARLASKKFYGS